MEDDYFTKGERLAVLIDGPNLYAAAKGLGIDIDYRLLRAWFAAKARLIRIHYFTAVSPPDSDNFLPIQPLLDYLDYNGFAIETKPTKEFTDRFGNVRIKGNMDIEIAVTAMEMAGIVDHIVLVSGDGDFRALVAALQRKGVKVTVLSSLRMSPPMVADELRRQADQFLELDSIADEIKRTDESRAKRSVEVVTRRQRSVA